MHENSRGGASRGNEEFVFVPHRFAADESSEMGNKLPNINLGTGVTGKSSRESQFMLVLFAAHRLCLLLRRQSLMTPVKK
eukprot:5369304-Amphidinium_carterae.1